MPTLRFRRLLFLVCMTAITAAVFAHEGHAPLPTRGATIDREKGLLILSREARGILDVKTVQVGKQPVAESVLAYAKLESPWTHQALVSSMIAGRIVALKVVPGQRVKAGDVLAELDSGELQALRLELVNAEVAVNLSEKLVARLEPAAKIGSVPAQRLLEARFKQQQDRIALEIARHKWRNLGLTDLPSLAPGRDRDDATEERKDGTATPRLTLPIRAPIGGTVIHADLSVGKVIDPKEHLFEIVDLSRVWARVDVLERDLARVSVGQKAELILSARPTQPVPLTLAVLGLRLDTHTHLASAWSDLTNESLEMPKFVPGMTGQARVILPGAGERLMLPMNAVIRDGAEHFVLVEEAETKQGSQYRKQAVSLGKRLGELVELRSGSVLPGDRVVTRGGHELAPFFVKGVLKVDPVTAQNIRLRVQPAGSQTLDDVIEIEGRVDHPVTRLSVVASPLAGAIHRVLVDRSQPVKAGDVIAEVRSLPFQELQLDLLRASKEVELLTEISKNYLAAADVLPMRQVLENEAALKTARNQVFSASQRLRTLGLSDEQVAAIRSGRELPDALPLRSPIDGVVVHFEKLLGHVVREDEPLFEIHDLSRAWIRAFVPEREAADMPTGQAARVRLASDPDMVLEGQVTRHSGVLDAETRSLTVWIELSTPAPRPLLHNQLAVVSLIRGQRPATLAVPQTAIIREAARRYVFIQKEDSSFSRRLVTTGIRDDRFVEILSGLKTGDRIAVDGVPQLQTGYAAIR